MNTSKRPEHLEKIVSGLIRKWEKGKRKKGEAVRSAWLTAAGSQTAGHAQPVSFKKGMLMVIVENSSWLYKMTMEKRDIITRFNQNYTGRKKLTDIRFRVGKTDI